MKKLNLFVRTLCAVVVSSLLLFSCGEGGKDYRNMLPKNSIVTFSLNPRSLSDKAKVGDFRQSIFYKLIETAMDDDYIDQPLREYLLSIIAEPSKSGLATDHDCFMFLTMDEGQRDDMEIGLLAKVNDRKAVDRFMDYIVNENNLDRVDEGKMTIIGDMDSQWETTVMVYNDDAFLFYHSENVYAEARPRIEQLFTQSREESLMGIREVEPALSGNNDMCMVMSFGGIISAMPAEFGSMPSMNALAKALYVMPFNFEKGRITGEVTMFFTDKEAEKEYNNLKLMAGTLKGSLAKYIPANSMFVVSANMNGAKVYEYLTSIPMYSMVMAMVPQVKTTMDAIEGDVVLSFNTIGFNPVLPLFTVMMEVNSTSFMDQFAPMLSALGAQPTGTNQYVISQGGIIIHFGIKDNILYATSDPETLAALSGEKIENIGDRYGKMFTSGYGAFVMDVAAIRNLITTGVAQRELPQDAMVAMPILQLFETLEAANTDPKNAIMEVKMTDKERNAADVIYHTVEGMVRMYAPMPR